CVLTGWARAGGRQLLLVLQGSKSTTRFRPSVSNPVGETAPPIPAAQCGARHAAVYPGWRSAGHGQRVGKRIDSGLASGRRPTLVQSLRQQGGKQGSDRCVG